ncbi:MAG: DUF4393 domain-containing protein [Arcobacteraceae bacterium]|nr:DUF4393 domain-containing protein [Arcobacteraceae bacterium]
MDESTSKAIQETAKTTGKGIDAIKQFGEWLAPYIGGSVEQAYGIFEDKLKYMRWSNQVDLMVKAEKKVQKLGLENKIKPLPLKIAIPLIEASSLEEDPYLKDLWVNLLVNSSSEDNDFTLERSYISVLEQLSSFEAKVLNTIYECWNSGGNLLNDSMMLTCHLPDGVIYAPPKNSLEAALRQEEYKEPSDDVKLALANLVRLQCVQLPTRRGSESYTHIFPTLFGTKLVEAVS